MRKAHTIKQWSELRKEVYLKRCPCSLCRSKKKRKETRTQRNGDYRPSVSRAKTKSHIFISEATKQETTGNFFLMVIASAPLPRTGVVLGSICCRQSRLANRRGVIIAPSGG